MINQVMDNLKKVLTRLKAQPKDVKGKADEVTCRWNGKEVGFKVICEGFANHVALQCPGPINPFDSTALRDTCEVTGTGVDESELKDALDAVAP